MHANGLRFIGAVELKVKYGYVGTCGYTHTYIQIYTISLYVMIYA